MSEFEGKRYDELTIIEKLRAQLRPGGTLQVVGLRTNTSDGIWVTTEFVAGCIDELERIPMRAAMGEKPTNLEKLAFMLLCDAAYIKPE